MAQSGYTPISLYYSTTASAVPVNTNLANGELAINITDGKLYYKDNTGTVKVLAGSGGAGIAAGSNTQVQYNNSGSLGASANFTYDGSLLRVGSSAPLGGTTNPILALTGSSTNYIQGYIYNSYNGVSSSADLVTYPNNGTDAHGWVDMGITSLAYADTTYTVTGPNEAYLFGSAPSGSGTTGNLVIATDSTGSANDIQFYTGGFTQAKTAAKLVIKGTGKVGIGTTTPAVSLAVSATDAALLPVGTTAQRPTGASGYIRFNSDTAGFEGYNGTTWGSIGGGSSAAGGAISINNQTASQSYTITSTQNGFSVGPITTAAGVTVTVSSGSRWVII